MQKLPRSYFQGEDVVAIAKDLIGKVIVTRFEEAYCAAIITETEAYNGITDKASHAYGGRRTSRTEIMYAEGGTAYVYLCYGIHHLFNIVTNRSNIPHAVLIRSVLPLENTEVIAARRGKKQLVPLDTFGPGKVSVAMGFKTLHSGMDLTGEKAWIEDRNIQVPEGLVETGPRIGVAYAGEDALLPYRFFIPRNQWDIER